jgi:cytochrome c oxidase subunit 3
MATIVQPPKMEIPAKRSPGRGNWIPVPADGPRRVAGRPSSPPTSVGIWVGLAAITMSFAAFTSALIVRQGGSTDWRHFSIPGILYINTFILLASSVTLEFGRRRAAKYMSEPGNRTGNPATWLYVTLGLGVLFVIGQYMAWAQLRSEGLYLATNPASSFFYVLTAAHALHIFGGLGGLIRVIRKLGNATLTRTTLNSTTYYWHFMDVLWLYLLMLLWSKL